MSQQGKQHMLMISGPADVVNEAYYKAATFALKCVSQNWRGEPRPSLPLWVLFWTPGA